MRYHLSALLAMSSAVFAADVDVRVTSTAQDTPVADAAVCLGTPAVPRQFGASRTDPEGRVSFENVPETPLLLTVSKTQHKSERRVLLASQNDRLVTVGLRRGGGGPNCSAPLEKGLAGMGTGLQVEGCRINRGAAETSSRTVTLECAAQGTPTHYRASEPRDFRNTKWQPYEALVRFKLSPGEGNKTVYFQTRRASEASGASLQMVSNTASDSIRLTSP